MSAPSQWKPKFHSRLTIEQLEDRTLSNALLQILGGSLLGPTFMLLNRTNPVGDIAVVREIPAGQTGPPPVALPSLVANDGADALAFLAFENHGVRSGGSGSPLVGQTSDNTEVRAAEPADLLTLDTLTSALSLGQAQTAAGGPAVASGPAPASGTSGSAAGGSFAAATGSGLDATTQPTVANVPPASMPLTWSTVATDALTLSRGQSIQGPSAQPAPSQPTAPARPLIPQFVGVQLTTSSEYVPVNADNDNGSPPLAISPLIPSKRDFEAPGPFPNADLDLASATVTLGAGTPAGGYWTITTFSTGTGSIARWVDQKKTAPFGVAQCPTPGNSVTFYLEGTHESSSMKDFNLGFEYSVSGSPPYTASVDLTITPVVDTLQVLPAGPPNICFANQVNGLRGLQAGVPPSTPGATFDGSVTRTNLQGNLQFIQLSTSVQNGANLGGAGWKYTAASGLPNRNLVAVNGTSFPLLDSAQNASNVPPFYQLDMDYTVNTADTQEELADDAPLTNTPTNSDQGDLLDVGFNFKLYLVWQFSSGIVYPLAYITWHINFYGDTNVPTTGISRIVVTNGINVDASTLSNNVPETMAAPFANGNIKWV